MNKQRTRQLLPALAALLLGAMLTLAFAPYDIFPLAIIAPAGLLGLWLPVSATRAGWLGFLFGIGFFGTGIYWVFHSIHVFGNVPPLPAGLITGGLIAILAIFPALTGYFFNRYLPLTNTKILLFFPALWVFSEWLRSFLFTGFPWLLVGYSQIHTPLKGYAPLMSVYGVSLVTLLSSTIIVNLIRHARAQKNLVNLNVYLHLFALAMIWLVGGAVSIINWTKPTGNPITVSLVQGNIAQAVKWSPEYLQLSLNTYENLTKPLWGKSQLIIWPEAAIPLPLTQASSFIEKMNREALKSGSTLIFGIPIEAAQGGYYNAIATVGKEKIVYLKRRLVPFGEYIPFSHYSSYFLNFMDIPMANMVPGKMRQKPFILHTGEEEIKILPAICYEIAFPMLMYSNDSTIGLVLTVNNDAWFGDSSAQAQHVQMAAMRALELSRPVIFLSNDGITAIIDAAGTITAAAPVRTTYVLNSIVQPRSGLTPWMQYSLNPVLALLLFFLWIPIALHIMDKIAKRQKQRAEQQLNPRPPQV
ncbi:MAG TPA: apolipoprotein N-acyltransferase [Gammaproteobacteria bacterium]|jgi:apolipoprotein N-acyltransferase|nr:apolipoprotein N-acyltransferase [Gammaproteobacteria bacterium]